MPLYNHHFKFLAATILRWQHLLAEDSYKRLITDSLEWLSRKNSSIVYGFVIMYSHIHLLWQRDSLVKECWSETFLLQKLSYIHHNLCQPHWNLSPTPEEYKWSSANFYKQGQYEFNWLKHYAS